MDAWRCDGMNCIVTGGTKGIGAAVVETLCGLGASVLFCARSGVDAHVAELRGRGFARVAGVTADVSTPEGRTALVGAAQTHFDGAVHAFVNNVGTNIRKATVDYDADELAHIMSTNFTSAFSLCQQLRPLLSAGASARGKSSCICFNSSVAGVVAISSGALYAASKASLNQLARNLACEWAPHIRVNAVCPWYTDTPLVRVCSPPALSP
jgi:Tropinone reductase 1